VGILVFEGTLDCGEGESPKYYSIPDLTNSKDMVTL